MSSKKNHWIIRVGDGYNFRNSIYPFWGVKKAPGSMLKKFKEKDILWFCVNKGSGGIIIGMAEYTHFYNRTNEPLLQINTYSNEEQGWLGEEDWTIQIHYQNLFLTEKQQIPLCIRHAGVILKYETFKEKIKDDLEKHYENFCYYSKPDKFKI